MKKHYIIPVVKYATMEAEEGILLPGSNGRIGFGGDLTEDDVVTADTKEENLFGKNLWDEIW